MKLLLLCGLSTMALAQIRGAPRRWLLVLLVALIVSVPVIFAN